MNEEEKCIVKDNETPKWKVGFAKYFDLAVTVFIVAVAIICFYFLLFRFDSVKLGVAGFFHVVSPILVGFAFAYVLNPVVMFLEEKFLKIRSWYLAKKEISAKNQKSDKVKKAEKKPKKEHKERISDDNADVTNQNTILSPERRTARKLAIFVTVVGAVTLIVLLIMNVIPAFARSITALAEKFPEYYAQVENFVTRFIDRHEWISKQVPNINEILKKFNVMDFVSNYLNSLVSTAYNWVMIAFRIVYNVLIGLIVAMYLLGGKERYIAQIKKITYAVMKKEKADHFITNMGKTNKIFKSAILGKILDSILIGCICFIGMSVLGMVGFEQIGENRVLISVIVGVTNVIPFFGPYIGGIPSVLLLLCVNPLCGVVFAIFIVLLQQFDMNFLDPRVVGRSVGLSPFYVLCFCLMGGGFFGILGIIIASPTGAVIYGITKSLTEEKLTDKDLPTDTVNYSK